MSRFGGGLVGDLAVVAGEFGWGGVDLLDQEFECACDPWGVGWVDRDGDAVWCGVSEPLIERPTFSTQRCVWRRGWLVGVRSELRGVIRAGFRRRPCRRATPSKAPLFPRGSRARLVSSEAEYPAAARHSQAERRRPAVR